MRAVTRRVPRPRGSDAAMVAGNHQTGLVVNTPMGCESTQSESECSFIEFNICSPHFHMRLCISHRPTAALDEGGGLEAQGASPQVRLP